MNEQEWLASTDPAAMLGEITAPHNSDLPNPGWRASDRRLRLFACACCRSVWDRLTDPRSRRAVEVAERYADGLCDFPALAAAERAAMDAWMGFPENNPRGMARYCCIENVTYAAERITRPGLDGVVHAIQANLLRDIVGNPFRPVARFAMRMGGVDYWHTSYSGTTLIRTHDLRPGCLRIDPAWLTPQVLSLATAAYQEWPGRVCGRCVGVGRIRPYPAWPAQNPCPDCHGTGRIDDGVLCPSRLAILSDALVDAGCDDPDILQPLRGMERCGACRGRGELGCPKCSGEGCSPHGLATNGPCTAGDECRPCDGTGWRKADRPRFRGFHVLDTIRGVAS